jgi:hypothetical protein
MSSFERKMRRGLSRGKAQKKVKALIRDGRIKRGGNGELLVDGNPAPATLRRQIGNLKK